MGTICRVSSNPLPSNLFSAISMRLHDTFTVYLDVGVFNCRRLQELRVSPLWSFQPHRSHSLEFLWSCLLCACLLFDHDKCY
jgi:hypothetical protein